MYTADVKNNKFIVNMRCIIATDLYNRHTEQLVSLHDIRKLKAATTLTLPTNCRHHRLQNMLQRKKFIIGQVSCKPARQSADCNQFLEVQRLLSDYHCLTRHHHHPSQLLTHSSAQFISS